MKTIAEAVGVSKNTVSLALRNSPQIPPSTRDRIKAVAEKLGYQRDPVIGQLMARLRSSPGNGHQATLALLNAHQDEDAFRNHPTIPTYYEGCRRRAEHLGYALDPFWLHDPALDGKRLDRILRTRNIRGAIVIGLMKSNRLPPQFDEIWQRYPCVVTGVRTRDPALSFVSTDHYIVALRAFEKALELGYRRPGLVLDEVIDHLVEGRFSAGYRTAQLELPEKRRLPPFLSVESARKDRKVFESWLVKYRPDVIFTLYNEVREWVRGLGFRIPDDVGLIQLEWRRDHPDWAGMDQHNQVTGEAAVDMVVSMLHSGENGPPPFPRATLLGGSWMEGKTIRPQSTPKSHGFHCKNRIP